jgi:hypothetical protein
VERLALHACYADCQLPMCALQFQLQAGGALISGVHLFPKSEMCMCDVLTVGCTGMFDCAAAGSRMSTWKILRQLSAGWAVWD